MKKVFKKDCEIYLKSGKMLVIENTTLNREDFLKRMNEEGIWAFELENQHILIRCKDIEAVVIGEFADKENSK